MWGRKSRKFITASEMPEILVGAAFARAEQRVAEALAAGARLEKWEPLPEVSTWELVCVEIVDTRHNDDHEDRCIAELLRRGITTEELQRLRDFAWRTAGWLNFEMMLWDWDTLNEKDILLALDKLAERKEITPAQLTAAQAYVAAYTGPLAADRGDLVPPVLPP